MAKSPLVNMHSNSEMVVNSQPTGSPLAKMKTTSLGTVHTYGVSKVDVDELGSDISSKIGKTTERIVEKITLNHFEDLGTILATVKCEADKLDPHQKGKSLFTDPIGWTKSKITETFSDIKVELTKKLNSANTVFNQLETKLVEQIAIHSQWIKDLESIYTENYDHYTHIILLLNKAKEWEKFLQTQLDALPLIDVDDPEAMMKAEDRRNIEVILNRVRVKIDNFLRLKIIAENNGPKIRNQIASSEMTIDTLRDVIDQIIPTVKMEFALYLNSIQTIKSQGEIRATKMLANSALVASSEKAKEAAVNSAALANESIIDNNTLNKIRSTMIDTITQVKKIESDAQVRRENDLESMKTSQRDYINSIQQSTFTKSPLKQLGK